MKIQKRPKEIIVDAVYEDGVLRPAMPLDVPAGTALRLRISNLAGQIAERLAPHHLALMALAGLAALLAQLAVAREQILVGLAIYLIAIGCAVAGAFAPRRAASLLPVDAQSITPAWRFWLVMAAIVGAGMAFAASGGNRYRLSNVLPWLLAVASWFVAWADVAPLRRIRSLSTRLRAWLTGERAITLAILVAILAIGALFRFWALFDNPLDMNSDQAEKLLDVNDLLKGTYYIFFERNTGREPWQFYWTLALIKIFHLQPDFMALKIGTSLIGWLMLPAVFMLGREVIGSRGALIATLFAAVASWGVITARYGLRYPLAPCATAWTLALLVRGLRRDSRNSMLGAGLWMGIGLQGYTSYRFMIGVVPLLVGLWIIWLLRRSERKRALRALINSALALIMVVLVMLPLLHYGIERPDQLFYRSATRLTSAEQQIVGNPLAIFVINVGRVLLMFNYTADQVWVANLPDRPAMDILLGGLLVVGAVSSLSMSWRSRNPWPALILLAGVLMLMPSALSIAFPDENPSVVRTGGALPELMVVCATAPALVLEIARALGNRSFYGAALAGVLVLGLLVVNVNRERVFVDYPTQYCPRAQNASDIGAEMLNWLSRGGERRNAWIVGYPYWVDSRAIGVWIGDIYFPNTVMGPEQAAAVTLDGPGWFVLNPNDAAVLETLQAKYPYGHARTIEGSHCTDRQFVVFETEQR